ncbi:tetratricopeptide repeat protein [Catenovulum sediminis]|uniref:Tetratricopeptide repeat protein n=1 Tax=Catenovulum sediminis TaxID=1740262 RepID=A0ABV1RD76_9ALTE
MVRVFSTFWVLLSLCCVGVVNAANTGSLYQAENLDKYLKSEKRVVVQAQKFIEAGEFDSADKLTSLALRLYPKNDMIYALRGEALYQAKQFEPAEAMFMQALNLNPLNTVAKKYIEEIRTTSELSESVLSQEWKSVARDKVGDFIVLVIGIWLGTTLNTIGARIGRWRFRRHSKKLFLANDFDDFADLLEIQLASNELKPLRESMAFMLRHKSLDESIAILEEYVNRPDHLDTFIRMLKSDAKRMELEG